jgi:cell division protein ZapD
MPSPSTETSLRGSRFFEHPLNERIRLFLRLEWLFTLGREESGKPGPAADHARLDNLLQIENLLLRGDVRKEILREFERIQQAWNTLRTRPSVDGARLERLLGEFSQKSRRLLENEARMGESLRHCELLNLVKSRSAVPGGAAPFEVPAYAHWIQEEAASRQALMARWYAELEPIEDPVRFYLKLLRESAPFMPEHSPEGTFEEDLGAQNAVSLIRIGLPAELSCFPEVSASRHRLFVRFLTQSDPCERPEPFRQPVHWQLQHGQL